MIRDGRHTLLVALVGVVVTLSAQAAGEQLIPIFTSGHGVERAGRAMPAGLIDYLELLNLRDGGINGVRLRWEECESAFDEQRSLQCLEHFARRGAALALPLSADIPPALTDRSRHWRIPLLMLGHGAADAADGRRFPFAFPLLGGLAGQAAAQIRFIGINEGGMDRLRGKRIAYLFLDLASGRAPVRALDALAARWDFDLIKLAVPVPGTDQRSSWQRLADFDPDWILLLGSDAMSSTALRSAFSIDFPARRVIGFGAAERDLSSAGRAAIGHVVVVLQPSGRNFEVIRNIARHVHSQRRRGPALLPGDVGSVHYNRGVIQGILAAEAIRVAQRRFGARPLDGEQLQWGLEHLSIDESRLADLGALAMLQPIRLSCRDHEGSRAVKFQQWLGTRWSVVSDWISGDPVLPDDLPEPTRQARLADDGMVFRDCASN